MKTEEIVTSDLSKFGFIELKQVEALIREWREHGLPKDFYDNEVTIAFNTNSGYVFLTNSEYQAAMLTDDGKLELWHNCPQCGHEGFLEDMEHGKDDKDCQEYLKDIKEAAR